MTTISFRLARVFHGKRACTTRLTWLAVLVVLVGSAFTCAPRIAASSDQKLTQTRVPTPPAQTADLQDALMQLAHELRVPIGLEACAGGPAASEGIALNNPGADAVSAGGLSLADVLNDLVRRDPRYVWAEDNGVISVFPKPQNRDATLDSILSTEVGSFDATGTQSVYSLRRAILDLPEVKTTLSALNVTALELTNSGSLRGYSIGRPLSVRHTALREILNEAVKGADRRLWVAAVWGRRKKALAINFL